MQKPKWHWRAGVLTKLDIMDPGTNARDVLDGQSVRLKHGWIGIVNRGQADIMSKVSIAQCSIPHAVAYARYLHHKPGRLDDHALGCRSCCFYW